MRSSLAACAVLVAVLGITPSPSANAATAMPGAHNDRSAIATDMSSRHRRHRHVRVYRHYSYGPYWAPRPYYYGYYRPYPYRYWEPTIFPYGPWW